VKALAPFSISFKGLKPGDHPFDFLLTRSFFDEFAHGEIHDGEVQVRLILTREERMLLFHFSLSGEVKLPCDRCLEEVIIPVEGSEQLIVRFGETFSEESDDVVIIPETETRFDVAPYLYEYVHLLLPMRRVHPDDEQGNSTCNPEVIKKLEELSKHPEEDPRWEGLKELRIES